MEVRYPRRLSRRIKTPRLEYKPVEEVQSLADGKKIQVESLGTLTYGFFIFSQEELSHVMQGKAYRLSRPSRICHQVGSGSFEVLALDSGAAGQRISLLKYPMPVDPFWEASVASMVPAALPGPDGPRVAESHFEYIDGAPIDIKILIDHDLVEAFVDEKVALTYRCYDAAEYEIGIIVQDGNAEFEQIVFKK